MEVLKLVAQHGVDKALELISSEPYNVNVRRDSKDGVNLVALNYDQIDSPKHDPIIKECRGLILCGDTGAVVSRSFDRFFNHGETDHEGFMLERSLLMEKVDGSLMKLYHHKGDWHVSTRGTCFADVPVGAHDITFSELFWRATIAPDLRDVDHFKQIELQKKVFLAQHHENLTYIYELACRENRVVTRYPEDQLVLLGVRSKIGHYKSLEYMTSLVDNLRLLGFNVRLPQMFKANSFEEVVEFTKQLGELKEGFVAWDVVSDERIKFKSPAYVAVHHIRGNGALVPSRVAALVLLNEHEEYLSYFQEDREFFEPYIKAHEDMISRMDWVWNETKDIVSQKDFALAVKDFPFAAMLFTARKLGITPAEAMKKARQASLVELLISYKKAYD